MKPCCWVYVAEPGEAKSVIHSHVDDLMFGGGGGADCPVHQKLMFPVTEHAREKHLQRKMSIAV